MSFDHLFSREPWPHQRIGVEQTIEALANGTDSVCLTAPTGSGKTAMQIALARWAAEDLGQNVLCLTNRILLTDQTRRVFEADGIRVGVLSASLKHLERQDAQVQIATIQTILARRRAMPDWLPHANTLLVDEVHQQATGESAALINEYKDSGAKVVGVTATPLGVCNVCDELIVAARTRDLQDDKILCFAKWFAPSELDTRQLVKKGKVDLSLTENEARKTWGPLRGGDQIRQRIVGNMMDHYKRLHPEMTHTLAFAPGVKESVWAANFCRSQGIRALHVDGTDFWVDGKVYDRGKEPKLFEESMLAWREGHIPILWNRFVLREGIDEPQIKCIILATPIGSYRSFLQMVGRGLRTHPDKDFVKVIDHGGAWWRHGSVNVNVDWESVFDCTDPDVLSKNRIAEQRQTGEHMGTACPKCGMVHRGKSRFTQCQYCGHQIQIGKASRPIIQADGTLTEVTGEPIEKWKVKDTPEASRIWAGLYWNAVKNKGGDMTFNQLYVQFAYITAVNAGSKKQPAFWHSYYPPRDLPLMPRRKNDWHQRVGDVPRENLY